MERVEYMVPGVHCDHCRAALQEELSAVRGVESVEVDLEKKLVLVGGNELDDATLRAAIEEAGYEAA